MKNFIFTFTLTLLAIFFVIKIFVPPTVIHHIYIPSKLGFVLTLQVLISSIGLPVKLNYPLCIVILLLAALLVATGSFKIANDLVIIFYILLLTTIIYDFIQTLATQYGKNNY